MKFPVFDLHCDTAEKLIRLGDSEPSELKSNKAHIDLNRASALPGYAQCFACFTTTDFEINPVDLFEKKMTAILREISKNYQIISQVFDPSEIESNTKNGLMSAILTIEGPAGFGFDPELLEDLYKVGFRMSSLSWNEKNPLTGSHLTGGGLTDMGREYIKEAQRLGMIIDVSHISDEGFWDIMDITQAPIVASHSNSRSMHNVSRNLTDEMFLHICKTDGVAGINFVADFLSDNATVDSVCDHVLRFMDLDPTGKHVALGGDLDGCKKLPVGFDGIQGYTILAERLAQRGLDDETIYNIFWNNALEVFKRCCT